MIYRGLENIKSIGIKCREWDHHILHRVHAELCVPTFETYVRILLESRKLRSDDKVVTAA
jgi:hypothetical protein